jgi:hypothetical protein
MRAQIPILTAGGSLQGVQPQLYGETQPLLGTANGPHGRRSGIGILVAHSMASIAAGLKVQTGLACPMIWRITANLAA